GEGEAERDVAVDLQEVVQLIDVAVPDLRSAMNHLGDVRERFLAEAEQVFALGVALCTLARDRSNARRTMLWQGRALAASKLSLVLALETPGDELHAIAVEPERARQTERVGMHRVRMRVVQHVAGRADGERDAQRETRGRDAQRTQPRSLVRKPDSWDDARRTRRTLRVDVVVPLAELAMEVVVVDETTLLEEGALDPADEILDRALLLGAVRPAQLDADAEVERDASERRIPLGDHAFLGPLERDGLRAVEDGDERHAAPRSEVIDHRSHERLDLFVLDEADLHPARVLQARGEEVHALHPIVEVAH